VPAHSASSDRCILRYCEIARFIVRRNNHRWHRLARLKSVGRRDLLIFIIESPRPAPADIARYIFNAGIIIREIKREKKERGKKAKKNLETFLRFISLSVAPEMIYGKA